MAIDYWELRLVVGDTQPKTIQVFDDEDNLVSVSGKTITGKRAAFTEAMGSATALTGTLEVDATVTQFVYTPSSADVATAGTYWLQFTFTSGGGVMKSYRGKLIIAPAIA